MCTHGVLSGRWRCLGVFLCNYCKVRAGKVFCSSRRHGRPGTGCRTCWEAAYEFQGSGEKQRVDKAVKIFIGMEAGR